MLKPRSALSGTGSLAGALGSTLVRRCQIRLQLSGALVRDKGIATGRGAADRQSTYE